MISKIELNREKKIKTMIKDKAILVRITTDDYNRITALKQTKKANNEAFNLSKLIRNHLQEIN